SLGCRVLPALPRLPVERTARRPPLPTPAVSLLIREALPCDRCRRLILRALLSGVKDLLSLSGHPERRVHSRCCVEVFTFKSSEPRLAYPGERNHVEQAFQERFHADRALGGDSDHRHPHRPALARRPESA